MAREPSSAVVRRGRGAGEYRQTKRCELCRTSVLRGALVVYRGQELCGRCVVKLVRAEDGRRRERRAEECPRVR
jgi:hypothetical protein